MIKAKTFRAFAIAICIAATPFLGLQTTYAAEEESVWPSLSEDVFGAGKTFVEEDGSISLDAPYRAEDAALVPLTIRIPAKIAPTAKSLTLIIEKNPAPVVAKFDFGPAAGIGERVITTRVRINMYSNVRAVVETDDGKLYMTTKFVKASGGCSAPALKDADQAHANIGKMKLKTYSTPQQSQPGMKEAQIMIRHPNYSGLQMDQATGLYIPAKFVEHMQVRKGDEVIFTMVGGISLSENPNIRFTYGATKPGSIFVTAKDTDGRVFEKTIDEAGS